MSKYFNEPNYYDHEINDEKGRIGTIRIKPSTIMWKPKSGKKFKAVSLDKFQEWITTTKDAREIER